MNKKDQIFAPEVADGHLCRWFLISTKQSRNYSKASFVGRRCSAALRPTLSKYHLPSTPRPVPESPHVPGRVCTATTRADGRGGDGLMDLAIVGASRRGRGWEDDWPRAGNVRTGG